MTELRPTNYTGVPPLVAPNCALSSGDFFKDHLPADVIGIGHVIHDWNEEQKAVLGWKAYEALHVGATR